MLVLGIETSCDETAASVVEDGRFILSNIVASSIRFHRRFGGIVPEIASRKTLETITFVVDEAIKKSKRKLKEIGLIAVTNQPGFAGSLYVGNTFAQALSFALGIRCLEIDHLIAHLYAAFFSKDRPLFPFIGFVVSGGHTSLFLFKNFDKIRLLGTTLDDACGEAFDKVAQILGLGYPGGPIIEKWAKRGNPKAIRLKCSNTKRPLDFSFSGIKTAVLYYVKDTFGSRFSVLDSRKKRASSIGHRASRIADIAASFQETVINTLIEKSFLACSTKCVNQLVIGGGVVCNQRLRQRFREEAKRKKVKLHLAAANLCTDNAAMVAGLGAHWG